MKTFSFPPFRIFYILLIALLCGTPSLKSQVSPTVPMDLLMGKDNPYLVGTTYQLHEEVFAALEKMKIAAAKDGVEIRVVSAYRSYARQRAIWNRKYLQNQAEGLTPEDNRKKIITYSTLPGTSRHHWGTDVDIIDGSKTVEGDVLLAKHFHNGGPFESLRIWLEKNAAQFGFFCAYPDTPNRTGFNYEPWHYSYRPLARSYFEAYKSIPLFEVLKDSALEGHKDLSRRFLKKYRKTHINGIAKALQ